MGEEVETGTPGVTAGAGEGRVVPVPTAEGVGVPGNEGVCGWVVGNCIPIAPAFDAAEEGCCKADIALFTSGAIGAF